MAHNEERWVVVQECFTLGVVGGNVICIAEHTTTHWGGNPKI